MSLTRDYTDFDHGTMESRLDDRGIDARYVARGDRSRGHQAYDRRAPHGGLDRAYDRSYDRGLEAYDRTFDRSYDRGLHRANDRGLDRAYDRGLGRDRRDDTFGRGGRRTYDRVYAGDRLGEAAVRPRIGTYDHFLPRGRLVRDTSPRSSTELEITDVDYEAYDQADLVAELKRLRERVAKLPVQYSHNRENQSTSRPHIVIIEGGGDLATSDSSYDEYSEGSDEVAGRKDAAKKALKKLKQTEQPGQPVDQPMNMQQHMRTPSPAPAPIIQPVQPVQPGKPTVVYIPNAKPQPGQPDVGL